MTRRPAAHEIVISLADIDPPIWRRVIVSSTMTLHELHRTIQLLFDWYDYHLYEFIYQGRRFEAPSPDAEGEDATRTTLRDLDLRGGSELRYVYDFGDEWVHIIEVERKRVRTDGVQTPWLLDGEGRGPPEDCGGAIRYMQLLAALEAPLEDLDDGARELVQWAGVHFDPEEFSIDQARHALLLSSAWLSQEQRGH